MIDLELYKRTTAQIKKEHETFCWHCRKIIDPIDGHFYTITKCEKIETEQSNLDPLSRPVIRLYNIPIAFHKTCFVEVAGTDYVIPFGREDLI